MKQQDSQLSAVMSPGSAGPPQKRKLRDTDFEIADSDSDDFGWHDEDAMPDMPPQWQGSEDILLGRQTESDDDDGHGGRDDDDASDVGGGSET